MNSDMPRTLAVSCCNRRMISLALALRSAWGFRLMRKRPELKVTFEPSTPMNELRLSTSGSPEDDPGKRLLVVGHLVEGNIFGRLRHALNDAGVLDWKEPFRDCHIEVAGEEERAERDEELMPW